MKLPLLSLATTFSLMVCGCNIVSQTIPFGTFQFTPNKALIPPAQINQRLTQAQADALMQHLANAINRQDANTLQSYLPDSKRDLAAIEVALADYNVYFQSQPITRIELEQVIHEGTWMQQPAQNFTYRLFNRKGDSLRVRLDQERGHVWLVDHYFRYSYLAKQTIERLIRAVQTDRSGDRTTYAKYRATFDPGSLKYGFEGLDTRGFFKYTLYGSKAGKPVTHAIIVVLGDNDVSLEDSFLPTTTNES